MHESTLLKANELAKEIKEFKEALNCFEIEFGTEVISTDPRLIIEFEDFEGGRDNVKIPMNLNAVLIDFLKTEIKKGLAEAEEKFKQL